MRRNRLITNRGRRRGSKILELDITSLLDILVILLVFLLKSYNSSGVVFNVPKDIQLPLSESISVNNPGVMIQVSPEKIWVDNLEIISSDSENSVVFDQGKRRIVPLYNELIAKKNTIEQVAKSAPNGKPFSGLANLIVDKTIKYSYLKKILYTCASAGFKQYKFVVLGTE